MIRGKVVLKNNKVQKPKFRKKSESSDQFETHELHVKAKHHDKAMFRMLKDERYDDAEY